MLKTQLNKHTVAINIPFLGSKVFDLEMLISNVDNILTIGTNAIANTLFAKDAKSDRVRPNEIFQLLLENWECWVTMLHSSRIVGDKEELEEIHNIEKQKVLVVMIFLSLKTKIHHYVLVVIFELVF